MAQVNFTLDMEFLTGLFSQNKDEAFGKLMEAILNQILKAESSEQLGAEQYERSDSRCDYRNGSRTRELTTRIGKIELEVPRHRNIPFTTMLFENYQRNEQALITTMVEMVVQGVSTRKVQKVTEELCGKSFSKSTVSEACRNLDIVVNEFKNRKLGRYPFVMADAMYVKVRDDHRVHAKAVCIAIGINPDGRKEILGFKVCNGEKESIWKEFFEELVSRGLSGVDIVTSDNHKGLVNAIKESFPNVSWQRCQVHLMRNILDKTPKKYSEGLKNELRTMFNAATMAEARRVKEEIYSEYIDVASEAIKIMDEGFEDTMTIMALPEKYRKSLRTSNIIERENREIRRRENVIQVFPNIASATRLIGAILMDHHNDWIVSHRLFNMDEYFREVFEIKKKIEQQKAA
ncbi:MAG: IS256 family transposase [Bacillota bacterium]|nr:IS256 family transposase [Bacillota bacterium]